MTKQGHAGSHAEASTLASTSEALKALVQKDSKWFSWRYGSKIHYRQKGDKGPCILLVHGFGVGSFQFIPLMDVLAEGHQVWALDLLGQGLSWPSAEALEGVSCLELLHQLSSGRHVTILGQQQARHAPQSQQ